MPEESEVVAIKHPEYTEELFAACLLECGPHQPKTAPPPAYHLNWEQERARVYTWYIQHIYKDSLEGQEAGEQAPRRVALWVEFWRQYIKWIEDAL